MKSHITANFRKGLASLPVEIRVQAAAASRQFRQNHRHPGLQFKQIQGSERLMSVRVNRDHRAVGVRVSPSEIVWYWIGGHDEYDKLLAKSLKSANPKR